MPYLQGMYTICMVELCSVDVLVPSYDDVRVLATLFPTSKLKKLSSYFAMNDGESAVLQAIAKCTCSSS